MTTFDPGASVVLTHGLRVSPLSTAFFASSAAPIITDGLDVFVHDVIAAMTTAPWSTDRRCRPRASPTTGWHVRPRVADPLAAEGTVAVVA